MKTETVIKAIGDYWDERSASFDMDHDTEDADAWMQTLSSLLGGDKTKNVLDLGTGTGFLANMTARLGYPTVGMDLSPEMMRHAVRHAAESGSGAVYMCGDALELPFVDETVDTIVNARLIWTIVEPDGMIAEWRRVLKPGGALFCFNRMQDGVGLTTGKNGPVYASEELDAALSVKSASMDELVLLLQRNGFVNVEIRRLPGLTRPEFDYECWYVLTGEKPMDPKREAELQMAKFWDQSAPEYEQAHRLQDTDAWEKALSELVGENRALSILDVATGTGMLANALGARGYEHVKGCDISAGMMRIAKQHAREQSNGATFEYGNAEALPYLDESFDIVLNSRLLWTIEDASAAASEWWRVLKPGGRVLALNELENGSIVCGKLEEYKSSIGCEKLPFSNASDREITAVLEEVGFQNVGVRQLPGCRSVYSDHDNWYVFEGTK